MSLSASMNQLSLAWAAYLVATASPGPGVMAIIGTSISAGRKAGLALALGVLSGSITWAALTTLGVSALIRTAPFALSAIQLLGACYLLWLAYSAFRKALQTGSVASKAVENRSLRRHYLKGYGVHLTNPKAVLAWIMLASLALPPGAPVSLTLLFVGGCLLIGFTVFTSFALVFSIPAVHRGYMALRRPIEATIAVLFSAAAIALLRTAL